MKRDSGVEWARKDGFNKETDEFNGSINQAERNTKIQAARRVAGVGFAAPVPAVRHRSAYGNPWIVVAHRRWLNKSGTSSVTHTLRFVKVAATSHSYLN